MTGCLVAQINSQRTPIVASEESLLDCRRGQPFRFGAIVVMAKAAALRNQGSELPHTPKMCRSGNGQKTEHKHKM
jgi:hypothetical protein